MVQPTLSTHRYENFHLLKLIYKSVMADHLQTLYKTPFSLLTGSVVNAKACSLKNDSNARCEQSSPTTV